MKRSFFFGLLALVLLPQSSRAQAYRYRISGTVVLFNSGGKPVAGVNVSTVGKSATVTDRDGKFELLLYDKQPGDQYILYVEKEGLEVVNKDNLYQYVRPPDWDGDSETKPGTSKQESIRFQQSNPGVTPLFYLDKSGGPPVKIVMAPVGELDKNKAKYYNIIKKQLRKENLDTLNASALLAQVERMAEAFAQTDVTVPDVSPNTARAYKAFQEGRIEEALRILSDAENVSQRIKDLEEERKKLREQIEALDTIQKNLDKRLRELARSFYLKANLHFLNYEMEEADTCYRNALRLAREPYILNDYTKFLIAGNRLDSAIRYNQLALQYATSSGDVLTARYYDGYCRQQLGNSAESLSLYSGILEAIPDADADPADSTDYSPLWVRCHQQSADILLQHGDTVGCAPHLQALLEYVTTPTGKSTNPGMTYRLLGDLHAARGQDSMAEKTYREGIWLLGKMTWTSPDDYYAQTARLYGGLFRLYLHDDRIPEAKQAFEDEMFQYGDLHFKPDEFALRDLLSGLEYLYDRHLAPDTLFDIDATNFSVPAYTSESLLQWSERLVNMSPARYATDYGRLILLCLQFNICYPIQPDNSQIVRLPALREKAIQLLAGHCITLKAWQTWQALLAWPSPDK